MPNDGAHTPSQDRGQQRQREIVDAAAAIVLEAGVAAVSHRAVALRAGVPLGSTTYYFRRLDDLLGAATRHVVERCLVDAEQRLDRVRPGGPGAAARTLVRAQLPDAGRPEILAYYEMLLGTARHPAVAAVLRELRPRTIRLIEQLLHRLGWAGEIAPELVLAIIDGAVVSALSEGRRRVRPYAERLLTSSLDHLRSD